MNEIVHANLPGMPLVHLPTPPPHIRAITDHVYFYLDRKSPLWPDFSNCGVDRHALSPETGQNSNCISGQF